VLKEKLNEFKMLPNELVEHAGHVHEEEWEWALGRSSSAEEGGTWRSKRRGEQRGGGARGAARQWSNTGKKKRMNASQYKGV